MDKPGELPIQEGLRPVDFGQPPVVETVLGVQFAPMGGWSIPHFGLLWSEIKDRYPRFEVQPPIGAEVGLRFGRDANDPNKPTVDFGSIPIRCWFFDASEATLLQVQNNCFFHNWRKVTGREEYLHYDRVRPLFREQWLKFIEFLKKHSIESPNVFQCEVSYVNHIERGKGWTFADLPSVLPVWSGHHSDEFLPHPEVVSVNAVYPIADKRGRLQVVMQPAIRQLDSADILQLTLTARGKPRSSQIDDILAWFDIGHEAVVRGFKSFTSPTMHEAWRLK